MIRILQAIVLCMAVTSLIGCAGQLTGAKTGTRTTTYDASGKAVAVSEEVAIGDPTTEQFSAIREVARSSADMVSSRAKAISEATAVKPGDSTDAAAWKSAFGALAIATIDDNTARNIAAVPKATTGYDVAMSAIGVVGNVATTGVYGYAATKIIDKVVDGAGDRVINNNNGDGNSNNVETAKTNITSTTTTTSTGDESPATATSTPTTAGASTSGMTEETASSLDAAIAACDPSTHTQGQVGTCLLGKGYKVKIYGGVTYVNGQALDGVEYGVAGSGD